MSADMTEPRDPAERTESAPTPPARQRRGLNIGAAIAEQRRGLATINWPLVLIIGIVAGVVMPATLAAPESLAVFAGIVPVGGGLIIGRRAKSHYGLHGFLAGLIGAVISLLTLAILLYLTPFGAQAAALNPDGQQVTVDQLLLSMGFFLAFSLLVFMAVGASISGRTEQRNRAMREEVAQRGGRLERAGSIRTMDDVRGLSLPQLGGFVSNVFKKRGFTFKDYRFTDKDKHLDMWMEYEQELWHLRMTTADKVTPGTVESLNQDMRREGVSKGVVITSTEFLPSAIKAAKNHRRIVLMDGETLFQASQE